MRSSPHFTDPALTTLQITFGLNPLVPTLSALLIARKIGPVEIPAAVNQRSTATLTQVGMFPGLCESIAAALGSHSAVLDGEIVCLDGAGRAQFNPLLYRRAEPHYYAFDCMWLDGRDLRDLPLVERKQLLRPLIPPQPSRLLYVSHIDERGVDLFRSQAVGRHERFEKMRAGA